MELQRQETNPFPNWIDGDQCTSRQLDLAGAKRAKHNLADRGRHNVLGTNLDDTGLTCPAMGQKRPKVEIVGEDHESVGRSEVHNFGVGSLRMSEGGPVDAIETIIGQKPYPEWAEVHVDQEFHAAGNGTSISSTRQAA